MQHYKADLTPKKSVKISLSYNSRRSENGTLEKNSVMDIQSDEKLVNIFKFTCFCLLVCRGSNETKSECLFNLI